ncbi:MAG: acyl-ACP--UDP-N-acetylglucosamine O-acyltransferase [Planctomycetota bacterium]|jgi:UDP-N-acetylglucosamine acyltransferase
MAHIHPSAVVDKAGELADGVTVGPGCVIEGGVSIGAGTVLDANVVISGDIRVGRDNHFFANCVIGGAPQVLDLGPDSAIGALEIGDNNTIREQVTIHPSMHSGKSTKVGSDNLLMIGVHVGHDCVIEDKVVLSNYVQVSGHCKIETGVWLSGVVLLHQFVTIGKWVYAAGLAGINHDVPPFLIVSGHYPPRVRGVNRRGMVRADLSERSQKQVIEAYKRLYRRGGALEENAKALAKEDGLDENVKAMLDVITKSSQHRFGRYRETFRD